MTLAIFPLVDTSFVSVVKMIDEYNNYYYLLIELIRSLVYTCKADWLVALEHCIFSLPLGPLTQD